MVIKSKISGIDVNNIVELRDATFFEYVFFKKTDIPQNISSIDSSPTTGFILDHVDWMTTIGVHPSDVTSGFD